MNCVLCSTFPYTLSFVDITNALKMKYKYYEGNHNVCMLNKKTCGVFYPHNNDMCILIGLMLAA